MAYFDGIKAGYKVYCLLNGEGEVVAVSNDGRDFPIHIQFGFSFHCITFDGKYRVEGNQIVFWQKPDIIDKGKPKDPLIKGAVYWVWMDGRDGKWLRIYSHSSNACDFFENDTCWSSQGRYLAWSNYELFKQPSAVAELSGTPEGAE